MSDGDDRSQPGACACSSTPEPVRADNRPGLDAIAFRVGHHGTFLARMLGQLSDQTVTDDLGDGAASAPLRALTVRSTEDLAIALCDAWASTLDVLSFYQERIANEGYLRTATERQSVLELARAIGYELNPGVAASAYLAFTVESSDDPFRAVDVPSGVQVLSVPASKDERPQVFETIEAIRARADWNAMRPRMALDQPLAICADPDADSGLRLCLVDVDGTFDFENVPEEDRLTLDDATLSQFYPITPGLDLEEALAEVRAVEDDPQATISAVEIDHLYLAGTATRLAEGDRLLAVGVRAATADDPAAPVRTLPLRVQSLETDDAYSITRVFVSPLGTPPTAPVFKAKPFVLKRRLPKLKTGRIQAAVRVPLDRANTRRQIGRAEWSSGGIGVFLAVNRWPLVTLLRYLRQPPPLVPPPVGAPVPGVYALRQSAGFFGSTAPRWETLASAGESRGGTAADPYPNPWDPLRSDGTAPGGITYPDQPRPIWQSSQGVTHANAHAYLEREVKEVVPDSWIVLETATASPATAVLRVNAAISESRSDFLLNGKTTALTFNLPDGSGLDNSTSAITARGWDVFGFRTTTAHVVSEDLTLAGIPIREDLIGEVAAPTAGTTPAEPTEPTTPDQAVQSKTELLLASLYPELRPGQAVAISGDRADGAGVAEDEILLIDDVRHSGGFTRLIFSTRPQYSYARPSLTVNANVALATHGETVEEILGSGDATVPNQAFGLAKPPVTFVPAETASGAASTIEVRVNGLTWTETPSLYTAGPEDQVFISRIDDDGTTRLVFGDGIRGARLPTGEFNITARYRSGMGFAGEVGGGSLIQLKTRPLGIRGVTNPNAASGAAPAEARDEARTNAPCTVRTLERIVSLSDYEDTARTFAGIGKAAVRLLQTDAAPEIHITVASASGKPLADSDPVLDTLRKAIARIRDAGPLVVVKDHDLRFFDIAATVGADSRFIKETVGADVAAALATAFGFARRTFAQGVSASAVVAVIQAVPGVVFVNLEGLRLTDDEQPAEGGSPPAILPAAPARYGVDGGKRQARGAELLLVNPAGINLTLETVDAA